VGEALNFKKEEGGGGREARMELNAGSK